MNKKLSRAELLTSLMDKKVRLHPSILEEFGRRFRFFPVTSGNWYKKYSSFNDEALKAAHECFIEKTNDKSGRFLEYRFAQWLTRKVKKIKKIDFRKNILKIGEIDIIGYDEKENIICIAECKARKSKASKEEIDPWLKSVRLVFNESDEKLESGYFVNLAGFSDGIKERMLKDDDITNSGNLIITGMTIRHRNGAISIGKLRVSIKLCEERRGKIKQVFP